LPARRGSVMGEIAAVYNQMADTNARMAKELVRVSRVIGREGRMTERMALAAPGAWGTSRDSVNSLIDDLARPTTEVARVIEAVNYVEYNLTRQVRNVAEVTRAVANGVLTEKSTVDVKGEILELKSTINVMVDQLSSFADEVARVAREVGTEGKLGGQAEVK